MLTTAIYFGEDPLFLVVRNKRVLV
jgi:hypothetical protein